MLLIKKQGVKVSNMRLDTLQSPQLGDNLFLYLKNIYIIIDIYLVKDTLILYGLTGFYLRDNKLK